MAAALLLCRRHRRGKWRACACALQLCAGWHSRRSTAEREAVSRGGRHLRRSQCGAQRGKPVILLWLFLA